MDFWDRLKDRIKEQKTTQEGVSKEIGVSYGTFRKWMDRKTYPDANEIFKIASFLKTTVEYLVNGKPPEGIPPDILDLARKIASLTPQDRREVMALIDAKLGRHFPEYQITQDRAPEFLSPMAAESPAPYPKEPFENDVEFLDWEMVMIPYFGKTAAGKPLDISIPPDEYMPFPRQALKGDPKDYFYLRIQGYSMVDAGVNEGDMVVIRRAEEPVNGEIMLVRHENSSTLKKIAVKRGRTYLCWEDGTGKQIPVNSKDFEVQGVLVWITKRPKK